METNLLAAYDRDLPNISITSRIISILGGVALLSHNSKKPGFLWASAAGLLLLRGVSGYCPLTAAFAKNMNINVRSSIVVRKSAEEVFAFWRNFENLPLFMKHLESVTVKGNRSEWRAKPVASLPSVSWEAEIVHERRDRVIGWKAVKGSMIHNAGKVEFTPIAPNKTRLDIVFSYRAPLGAAGENLARLFTPSFEKIVREDIVNVKQFLESEYNSQVTHDFRNEMI